VLCLIGEQQIGLPAALGLPTRYIARIDAQAAALACDHLPKFDENNRALLAGGLVAGAGRIAQIPARRIIRPPFREAAGKHQNLLAAWMRVARKIGTWRIAHDACRPGLLATSAIQHHALDPRLRRGHPCVLLWRDDGATREI